MNNSEDRKSRSPQSSVPPEAVVAPAIPTGPRTLRPAHLYKAVGLAFLLALAYRFFDGVTQVLLIAYAAVILAVALNIIVSAIPAKRSWVAGLMGVLILGGLAATLYLTIPLLGDQLRSFSQRIPEFQQELQQLGERLRQSTGLNVELIGQRTEQYLQQTFAGGDGGGGMLGRARGLLEVLFLPLLILFGGLYAVGKPNDRLLTPVLRMVPRDRRLAFRRVFELLATRLRGWVVGVLISMLAVGLLTTASLYLLGVQYALVLGIINGLAEFIPIVGPWIGGAIAVAVTFLDDPSKAVWVILVVVAIQQVESNLITPLVMARAAEVHPFVTLFALFLFGNLFGFLGVLLSLPLVLLFWTVIEVFWVERAIDTDRDPIAPVVRE